MTRLFIKNEKSLSFASPRRLESPARRNLPATKTAVTWAAQIAPDRTAPQSSSFFDGSLGGWATSSTAIVSAHSALSS
jgi:hypothetical protein